MALRIVQLGAPRVEGEGLRIGTVRRPPRGVKKENYAKENYYDVWYPLLAPSADTVKLGLNAENDKEWTAFTKKYLAEMSEPEASRTLDLLAALSHTADFSVGCYCDNEARCHRSLLRKLFQERGAKFADK